MDTEDEKFNLKARIFNKNGDNYCGIKEVCGLDYVVSKDVSHEMHFRSDINKDLAKLGGQLQRNI